MPELQPGPSQSVMDRAFMLVLEFGRFGTKAPMGGVTVDADKALLSMSKRLLKCPDTDAIVSHDREIKKWIESIAVPFPVQNGSYLIPLNLVEEIDAALIQRRTDRETLINAFLAVYPTIIVSMQTELRELYNAGDYPSVESVRERFKMDFNFLDYGVPGRLKHLNLKLYEAEKQKMAGKIAEATTVMQQALRESMAQLVEHMVDRLTPGDDGKKKMFKASAITGFQDFLSTFAERNLTNDASLDLLVQQAKNLLSGVDAEQIRSQDGLRDALANGFAQIKTQMDGMVTNRSRKILFEPSPSAGAETIEASSDEQDAVEANLSSILGAPVEIVSEPD